MTEYECCTTGIALGNALLELQVKTAEKWLGKLCRSHSLHNCFPRELTADEWNWLQLTVEEKETGGS